MESSGRCPSRLEVSLPFPASWRRAGRRRLAERLHDELQKAASTCCTTIDERPGVKFKDADLIGMPYRITVGKKGVAEAWSS